MTEDRLALVEVDSTHTAGSKLAKSADSKTARPAAVSHSRSSTQQLLAVLANCRVRVDGCPSAGVNLEVKVIGGGVASGTDVTNDLAGADAARPAFPRGEMGVVVPVAIGTSQRDHIPAQRVRSHCGAA